MSYVACAWSPEDPRAAIRARRFEETLAPVAGQAWRHSQPGLAILALNAAPLAVCALPQDRGVVIGDIYRRSDYRLASGSLAPEGAGPEAWARDLLATTWGPYVALLRDAPSAPVSIYREPSGALDGLAWREAGVTFVAGDLPASLRAGLPQSVSLDWDRVADMLIDPRLMAGPLALRGVTSVAPGTLLRPGGEVIELWSPARTARRPGPSALGGALALPGLVDGCVEALSRGRRVVAELSGGLDSAIVGSALCRAGDADVAAWLNYHPADVEGDERCVAQAVADHLGVRLTLAPKADTRIDPEALIASACCARPSLNHMDRQYDDDLAARCRALGVDTIFTGQGGDTLFFQTPTPLVAADALLRRGPRSWTASPMLGDVARWTRRSAWSVMGACGLALAHGGASSVRPPAVAGRPGLAASYSTARPAWTQDLGGVAPAKRRQIEGLAHTQLFHGVCARTRAATLTHPLLSTPIVEHLLSVSAADLTDGGRDRALARRAFADRLPPVLVSRQTKGIMTAYYGRMLAASLSQLRPWLLEGPLAQRGLVDREVLAAILTEDALVWRGGYAELMALSALQAWVETWP